MGNSIEPLQRGATDSPGQGVATLWLVRTDRLAAVHQVRAAHPAEDLRLRHRLSCVIPAALWDG